MEKSIAANATFYRNFEGL